MQKIGWLIINEFLRGEKYEEMYTALKSAASSRGVLMQLKTNAELMHEVGGKLPAPLPDA